MTYSRLSQLVETSIRYWVLTEEKRRDDARPLTPQSLRDYSDSESAYERRMMPCNAAHCPICEADGILKSNSQRPIPIFE
jgi:hypothetical protein